MYINGSLLLILPINLIIINQFFNILLKYVYFIIVIMYMNIHIQNWEGRLGSNIIQVLCAIQIGLSYDYNIILPEHKFFNKRYIVLNSDITKDMEKLTTSNNFFNTKEFDDVDMGIFRRNLDDSLFILRELFIIKDVYPLYKHDVVIHIKPCDMLGTVTHAHYMMPPLSYYTNILDKTKHKKVWLVAEDYNHPCVKKLQHLYPNIICKKWRIWEKVELLLGASIVIESFGTFVSSLLLVSKNIKTIYRPSYQISRNYNVQKAKNRNVNIIEIDLLKYLYALSPWRNTKKQRRLLLEY